ncbi:MAG: cytochrome c3 family protein [Coriobacteriales bacterium]|jgi:predicted CXXCH cytochrome family protein|nr:cytochrome c3 family protein [Coriobacteriales bacterium]
MDKAWMNRLILLLGTASLVVALAVAVGCAPKPNTEAESGISSDAGATATTGDEQAAMDDPAALGIAWSMDSDCASCHSSSAESRSNTAMLASQTMHATQDCITCHDGKEDLAKVHEDVVAAPDKEIKKLRHSSVANDNCLTCHTSMADLATKTAASTVLTDQDGTVVNPHDLPVNEDHASITCGNCHIMHKETVLTQDATQYCFSCHHQEVFVGCPTCHGVEGA